MSLVLVVSRPARPVGPSGSGAAPDPAADPAAGSASGGSPDPRPQIAAVWRDVRAEVSQLRMAAGTVTPGNLDQLAEAIAADDDDPAVTWAATPAEAVVAVEQALAAGAAAIAVLPIALAVEGTEGSLADTRDLERLHDRLDALGRAHPETRIEYVGPPFDDPPALEAAVAALRPGSDEPALLAGAVERAFDGDPHRFGRFVAALQAGVPAGTRLALRGSAVQGKSYKTGEPFDARGPGTSDLDVVLLGEEAMARWSPDAFYLPGLNTQPLYDEAPDVADPALEEARVVAQGIAGRPVALQAMAHWFLDLRSGLQGTPYVLLGGG